MAAGAPANRTRGGDGGLFLTGVHPAVEEGCPSEQNAKAGKVDLFWSCSTVQYSTGQNIDCYVLCECCKSRYSAYGNMNHHASRQVGPAHNSSLELCELGRQVVVSPRRVERQAEEERGRMAVPSSWGC